mgnify:FL=1
MLEKMKSRKFIATILTNIIAVATLFTANENVTIQIIALVTIGIANIVYGIVQGAIDAKAIAAEVSKTANEIDSKL